MDAIAISHDADWHGRVAARPIDERQATVGPEQEANSNVAARLATVLVVERRDLAILVRWATGCSDGVDQHARRLPGRHGAVVGRSAVVLKLFDRQQIRTAQSIHDRLGQACYLGGALARTRVLDVEGGQRELIRPGRRCALGLW